MAAMALFGYFVKLIKFLVFLVMSGVVFHLEKLLDEAKTVLAKLRFRVFGTRAQGTKVAWAAEVSIEGEREAVNSENAQKTEAVVTQGEMEAVNGDVASTKAAVIGGDTQAAVAMEELEASEAYSLVSSPLLLTPRSPLSMSSSEGLSSMSEECEALVPSRRSTGQFLGEGGNGKVLVRGGEAVKVMPADSWDGKVQALLEFHCAKTAGQGSINLVGARALTFANGSAEMSMELCSGDLWDLLNRIDYDTASPQALEQLAKAFLKQVAAGLNALHAQEYMHCDIKPGNVLLGAGLSLQQLASSVQSGGAVVVPAGAFKLSDFGLGISVEDAQLLDGPTGTPGYMAPEMEFLDPERRKVMDPLPLPTESADIYSLGCAVWEVLTGTQFFCSSEEKWSQLIASFSEPMTTMLAALLAYEPYERPTAQEILGHPTLFRAPERQARKARARWNLPSATSKA